MKIDNDFVILCNNQEESNKIQKYLFSKNFKWNMSGEKIISQNKFPIIIRNINIDGPTLIYDDTFHEKNIKYKNIQPALKILRKLKLQKLKTKI